MQPSHYRLNAFNEVGLKFPRFIDLEYLKFKFFSCCCKKKNDRFQRFHSLVKQGATDFTSELDVVRLVRRMRSYGIALYYLTNRK